MTRVELRTVLFADGSAAKCQVFVYQGACLAGEPTAFVYRNGKLIWLVPGESVQFVEATNNRK